MHGRELDAEGSSEALLYLDDAVLGILEHKYLNLEALGLLQLLLGLDSSLGYPLMPCIGVINIAHVAETCLVHFGVRAL